MPLNLTKPFLSLSLCSPASPMVPSGGGGPPRDHQGSSGSHQQKLLEEEKSSKQERGEGQFQNLEEEKREKIAFF